MKNYNNNANNNRNILYILFIAFTILIYNGFREMLVYILGISHREPSAANIYKMTQYMVAFSSSSLIQLNFLIIFILSFVDVFWGLSFF